MTSLLTQEQVSQIVCLKDKESWTFRQLAKAFKVGFGTVHKAYWTYKQNQGEQVPPMYEDQGTEPVQEIADGVSIKNPVSATMDGPNKIDLDSGNTGMITTLEQLLEYCKVDLEVWEVKDYKVNAWPGWAKHEQKDLTYVDGKATGHIWASGELIQKQLIQVKASLIRRVPVAVLPDLQAAPQFDLPSISFPDMKEKGRVYRALITGDWQVGFERDPHGSYMTPFHDRRYLDLVLQVAEVMQPDRVVLLGDLVDLPEWSKSFRKKPGFYWTTQPTIFELHYWLTRIRQILPHAPIDYLGGNHEARFHNAVIDYIPAMYQLTPPDVKVPITDFSYLFGLGGLGIEYLGDYPNDTVWLGPSISCGHGKVTRGKPGIAASVLASGALVTLIYGHGHKLELVGSTHTTGFGNRREGEVMVEAASPGCGCRLDYVVPGHNKGQDWRQGMLEVQYTMDGDHVILPLSVREGSMIYEGDVLRARSETLDGLKRAYPAWTWENPALEWWE